jgi:hypothetical protein
MMKEAQKMIIIGLVVLALLPGFIGVASATLPITISGNLYRDDTKTFTNPSTAVPIPGATFRLTVKSGTAYVDATPENSGITSPNMVTTGPDGLWAFQGISVKGTYCVTAADPAGYVIYKPGARFATYGINSASTDKTGQNAFAYKIPYVVMSGGVYTDNTPGTSTASPKDGVTVELQRSVGGPYSTVLTATTGTDGLFSFGPITAKGTYRLVETVPAGFNAYDPGDGIKGSYAISVDSPDLPGLNFFIQAA